MAVGRTGSPAGGRREGAARAEQSAGGGQRLVNADDPPGKLLVRLYREKPGVSYKKTVHGGDLFRAGDPDVVYAKCPSFQAMLDDMLGLARHAGL